MVLYRVILPVTDIEAAASFYSNLFQISGERVSPGRHYFKLGGTVLACYDPLADGDDMKGGWRFHEHQYMYFSVSDLEDIHQKLLSSACNFVDPEIREMPWGERLIYANDPFGNPVCFVDEKTIFTGNN